MEQKQKKKKSHAGLIVLIVIVLLLVVPLLVAYGYLSVNCARIEKLAKEERTAGASAKYLPNGDAEIVLLEGDVMSFLDTFGFREIVNENLAESPVEIELNAFAVELNDDKIGVSLAAKAFGFLPVPLSAEATVAYAGGEGELDVDALRIGKRISIPVDKLPLDMPVTFDLSDDDLLPRAESVSVSDGKLIIRQRFINDFVKGLNDIYEPIAAEIAANTPGGVPSDATAAFFAKGAPSDDEMFAYVASAHDSAAAFRDVLAMMRDYPRQKAIGMMTAYEKLYLFPYELNDVLAVRDAYLQSDCFAGAQQRYAAVLDDIVSRYQSLGFTLNGSEFLSGDSLTPLSFEAEYPQSGLSDADTRLCFMSSFAAWLGTDTLGMPNIDDVPREKRYKINTPLTKSMYYALALVTRLPDGTPAVVYYTAPGIFTECEISEEEYAEFMSAKGYVLIMTDQLQKPAYIYLRDAYAEGMKEAYYFVRSGWSS